MSKANKSLMTAAMTIVMAAYANPEATNPRKDAIDTMQEKLIMASGKPMAPTTAATYHALCLKKLLTEQNEAAEEKAAKGKPVWSVFKVKQGVVTSVGLFTTKKAATAFNKGFRHHGVEKGVVEVGDQIAA